jgi:ribosomal protein L24
VKLIGIPEESTNGQTSVSKGRIDEYRANNLILTVAERNTIEGLNKVTRKVKLELKEKVEFIIGKYFRCHQGINTGRVARVSSTYDRTYSVYILGEYKRTTMCYTSATGEMNVLVFYVRRAMYVHHSLRSFSHA